jgi:hypothetical protein
VDFDGDGIPDILTGCWPGQLYFFRGLGKGKFAAGQTLKDKDGKEINAGNASTVFACDFRGTGRLDLLVGCIEGHVFLIPNEGSRTKPAFGKPQKLKAKATGLGRLFKDNASEIRVPHGDSHPILADWEKTGKPGLIVGCGDGSVLWYRNEGTRKEPKFGAPATLVATPAGKGNKEAQRGTRAKVCVFDWNNDGHLDLLVGDFGFHQGPAPKLSEADTKLQKETQAKINKLQKELQPYYQEMNKIYQEAAKDRTAEAIAKRDKKLQAAAVPYKKQAAELSKLYQTLRRFQPSYSYTGHVWLFLRQPAERASAR